MSKIEVYEIEQITPGARHVWLRTNIGRIRKPIGEVKIEQFNFDKLEEKAVLVESRLIAWAKWHLRCTIGGLGYPTQCSVLNALQGSPGTGSPPLPDDPEAEETDKAVKKLTAENRKWGDVINAHYTREIDTSAEVVAKKMELSARTYFYYLNMGRKYIEKILKRC